MGLNRFTLTVIGTLATVFGIWWYIASLQSDIESRDVSIEKLHKEKADLELDVGYKKLDISKLIASIDKRNSELEKLKGDSEKLQIEIMEWKTKPPVIKYRDQVVGSIILNANKPSNDLCKDYIDLTKALNGVRYEDL